jgi:hypothetical protein
MGAISNNVFAKAAKVAELQKRVEEELTGIFDCVLNVMHSSTYGNTRTKLRAFFQFMVVKTVVCYVGISYLKINTFPRANLHCTFYPSFFKKNGPKLISTQIIFSFLCIEHVRYGIYL